MKLALGIVLALLLAAPAAAQRASLPDIEDEVMCVQCGTALSISTSPVAEQERSLIRDLIAQGKTKKQIKAALVAEYGPEVLALPEERGIGFAVYLVPVVLLGLGILAVMLTARRWRGMQEDLADPGEELAAADAERLNAELARFDG